ncbi:unnamed protein product, partial [Protopolystoma xenopodis]
IYAYIHNCKHTAKGGVSDVLLYVNTVCWDDSGTLLLSGSDDRKIVVTNVFSETRPESYSQRLVPESNIFTSKFLKCSNTCEIVTGFKCGCVVLSSAEPKSEQISTHCPLFCHKLAVYNVIPLPDFPFCFLSISHDRSVNLYDIRIPHYFGRNSQLCNRSCYAGRFGGHSSSCIVQRLGFMLPVTAGDIHPTKLSTCIALASVDGFVRLFDLRNLVKPSKEFITIRFNSFAVLFKYVFLQFIIF